MLFLAVTRFSGPVSAQTDTALGRAAETITQKDVIRRIDVFAADSMMGRDTPSRGLELAAEYVAGEFRRAGLRPAGDRGGYIQRYGLTSWVVDTARSAVRFQVDGTQHTVKIGRDARYVLGRIPQHPVRGPVTVVTISPADSVDLGRIQGRIVLAIVDFSGPLPPAVNQQIARMAGAGPRAVVVLSNRDSATFANRLRSAAEPRWQRDSERVDERSAPVIEVHERALRRVLAAAGIDAAALRRSQRATTRSLDGLTVELEISRKALRQVRAPNVAGVLEGSDPALRHEYLVYSAHIDHIGLSPGQADSINNGADDNASGAAGLLELVEAFSRPEARPRRSILFLAPSAEEPGLLGSAHYTEHPTVPLNQVVANLNMDLIGRNWPDSVIAVGLEQSDLGETLQRVVEAHSELGMTPIRDRWPEERIFYRSDHYNFARKGVPILFFTSGTHPDYHRPTDETDRINGEKAARLVKLLFYLGAAVANADARPEWVAESYTQIVERP
ncbi:MAG TPA: M28 family peptidase [Gemmatimonadales bacterium]